MQRIAASLALIKQDKSTSYDRLNEAHEALLMRLWNASCPGVPLVSRVSEQWKTLGFQGNDPATDFRGMGLLGLRHLVFFAEKYSTGWRELLVSQARRKERQYPVSVAGINLTYLLVNEVFLLGEPGRPMASMQIDRTSVDNLLADSEDAFAEVLVV